MNRRLALGALVASSALVLSGCTGSYEAHVTDHGNGSYSADVTGSNGLRGHATWHVDKTPKPTAPPTATPTSTVVPVPTFAPSPTTTKPAATTTVAPSPTPTVAPPPPVGDTAAARFGWGAPLPASDEFNGSAVDTSKWGVPGECWPANSTVKAGRCASHNAESGGTFRETGTADGKTGYLSAKFGQRYGRWEVRLRVTTSGSGSHFHPVLLLWPDSDAWPSGGEYDFFEVDGGDTKVTAFMHHPDGSQDQFTSGPVDMSLFHNYGFEWKPGGLTGYIDGVVWFTDTKSSAQAPGPMHATIQLDDFVGTSGMQQTVMEADWARAYAVT